MSELKNPDGKRNNIPGEEKKKTTQKISHQDRSKWGRKSVRISRKSLSMGHHRNWWGWGGGQTG